jgi:two-component system, cell cycle response regulator
MNDPDILKTNDEIARKFGEIEANLAVCREIGELFERLLLGSEEAFGVPFVWLSVLHRPETEVFLDPLRKSDILRDRINIIAPAPFLEILPNVAHPLLASGNLRPFFRLMPPNVKYFLRSLAVAPLTCHGVLIGSLNHGDASPDRYRPGMDTTLLAHLAQSISDHLSRLPPPEEDDMAEEKN